jgi:hypothetical protein
MVLSGKTLTFVEGNTHEGMHWTIIDEARGFPIDLTGATINVFIQGVDESNTIIDRVATIIDPTLGTCKLTPVVGEMDIPGNYKVQLHIVFADTTEVYLQKMSLNIISVLE